VKTALISIEAYNIFVAYREGASPLLCFIHGLGCDHKHYGAVWDHPAMANHAILIPDLPGYGFSSKFPEMDYSLNKMAELLHRLLHLWTSDSVVLVGHSMGGAIAQLMIQQNPHPIAGFVNVEGNLIGADCTFSRKASQVDFSTFASLRFPALQRAYENHPYGRSLKRSLAHTFYQQSQDLVQLSDSETLLNHFLHMSLPRVYVYGEKNRSHPVLPRLSTVSRIEIPNSGHFPMLDNPDDFFASIARAVASF